MIRLAGVRHVGLLTRIHQRLASRVACPLLPSATGADDTVKQSNALIVACVG